MEQEHVKPDCLFTCIPNAVLDRICQAKPAPQAVPVLLALYRRANAQGVCWPSINRIAEDVQSHRVTVCRALEWLAGNGFITTDRRAGEDKGLRSNIYTLVMPSFQPDPLVADLQPPSSGFATTLVADLQPPSSGFATTLVADLQPKEYTGKKGSDTSRDVSSLTTAEKRFSAPSRTDCENYAKEIAMPPTEAGKFFDYREMGGWKVADRPMKDWRAAMRLWNRTYLERGGEPYDYTPVPKGISSADFIQSRLKPGEAARLVAPTTGIFGTEPE